MVNFFNVAIQGASHYEVESIFHSLHFMNIWCRDYCHLNNQELQDWSFIQNLLYNSQMTDCD